MSALILTVAAIVGALLYPFTSEYTLGIAMSVTGVTLFFMIAASDRGYFWQIGWLLFALFTMIFCDLDQANDTNVVFSSYDQMMVWVTILQLAGVSHGLFDGVFERIRNSNYWKYMADYGCISPVEEARILKGLHR